MSGDGGGSAPVRLQIVVSGVGGQGVLFVTRLLADAAILHGAPVLTSETHGMAQRGGVVVSHLKVGGFASPLVRTGMADGLLVLKEENLPLHRMFLKPGGWIFVNASRTPAAEEEEKIHAIDADALAMEIGNLQSSNLALLGFALSRLEKATREPFFCTAEDLGTALKQRSGGRESLLAASLAALSLGNLHGKR